MLQHTSIYPKGSTRRLRPSDLPLLLSVVAATLMACSPADLGGPPEGTLSADSARGQQDAHQRDSSSRQDSAGAAPRPDTSAADQARPRTDAPSGGDLSEAAADQSGSTPDTNQDGGTPAASDAAPARDLTQADRRSTPPDARAPDARTPDARTPDQGTASGRLVFEAGFESGDIKGWRCSGNCPEASAAQVAEGKYAGHFVLTPDMPTNYRTEAVIDGPLHFAFGKTYRVELSYRYEDWAKDSLAESAPLQVHTTPSSWDAACNLGSAYSTAPFLIVSKNDELSFVTYGGKVLWTGPVVKNRWRRIAVTFRMSMAADGFVEFAIDGVRLGRRDGVNSPKVDKCGGAMREPYLKIGVYKWDWKRLVKEAKRRELFVDAVRVYAL